MISTVLKRTGLDKGKSSGSVAAIKMLRLPKKTNQNTGKNKARPNVREEDIRIMRDFVCLLDNARLQCIYLLRIIIAEERLRQAWKSHQVV